MALPVSRTGDRIGSISTDLQVFCADTHKQVLWLMVIAFWLSSIDAVRIDQSNQWPVLTSLVLGAGLVVALLLRTQGANGRPLLSAGALTAAYLTTVLAYPAGPARYFGVLVVLLCHGMLPAWQSGILMTCVLAGLLAIELGLPGAAMGWPLALAPLGLIALAMAMSWLSRRQLMLALAWATHGTETAHRLTDALRDRQHLLNRTLRAMEEATYRVERANNELVLSQREAEAARAAKAHFAAIVSHEIRGPLNLLLGFSRLMALSPDRYGARLTSAYYTDIDTIYRNTQHLCALVDDVLDLSRIETDHLPLGKDLIDYHQEVVLKTVDSVRPMAERRGLCLRTELANDVPLLVVDPIRMRQVVLNLLTNALRFTARGGITVRSRRSDEALVVTVEDTGSGIAAEELPRLFCEFSQLRAPKGQGEGGTGLGLSIARHLVEAHGGRMWAESQLGVGTRMSFSLPLLAGDAHKDALVRTTEIQRQPTKHSMCLVVHQDPDVVRLLGRYLEDYQVIGLRNENTVKAMSEQLHPCAIIAAPPLIPRIEEELATVPFDVPLISCPLPSITEQRSLEGILAYLVKPITEDELRAVTAQLTGVPASKVLIIDDDPDAVRLLETMLSALPYGYDILKAYDGLGALELMKATPPDLVFLDWLMPGLDGGQTIACMRADPALRQVPVVIISARDWIERHAVLGTPICVRQRKPLPIARGIGCLRALLESLSPDYLPETTTPEPLEPGLLC